jgi:hypothetical protein
MRFSPESSRSHPARSAWRGGRRALYPSSTMNAGHVAAFALLGWYLLMPPVTREGPDVWAKLSDWTLESGFDSAAECGEWRRRVSSDDGATYELFYSFVSDVPENFKDTTEGKRVMAAARASVQCIASDDPRLAR